ncbi:carboxypeptidase-like regulatory domain-containing protein [Algoriphagus ratkowskyi]|uniref:Carboxypeptidase-like regulatory domain-containing protein n=2 Tax=Algoriphagus ratkowskyi TaxID=57028 RepID=A0ABY3HN05_9BACT|nr:carboxypeptidase-like regulatory domain-containing protein [Algoriphagus ratkowskyi]TXD76710.1 carboxypeptidase-like regulatory domain-containing protein [Algoriphagus ratkowskyi]
MSKPNSMLFKIVLGLFLFFGGTSSYAQAIFKGTIEDIETEKPIPYASVFLANTTFGTSSDEEGKFSLDIPDGNYEVIIRILGYEGLTFNLPASTVQPQGYRFKLISVDEDLDEMEVSDVRDPSWYRNLDDFKKFFLGTSENSRDTEILNELSMILNDQSIPGTLIASSRDILQIDNINLGYRVEYLLEHFRNDYRSGIVTYSGFPLFIPDSNLSKGKQRRVEKNRLEAYYGSMQHFLKAVYDGKTVAEGFEMRRLFREKDPDRPGKFIDRVDSILITSIAIRKNIGTRDYLEFSDHILVTYLNEKESFLYAQGLSRGPRNNQTSIMRMAVDSLEIFENGSLSDPFGLVVEGYIGWERVGDLLPIDYLPTTEFKRGVQ